MNRRKTVKQACSLFVAAVLCSSSLLAQDAEKAKTTELTKEVQKGMNLFQGNKKFINGGPACIACHNVNNENVYPGGLFAKDLTEISSTFPGVGGWLMNPDRPAMQATYGNNQIQLEEGQSIEAFLNYTNANKNSKASMSGGAYLLMGGGGGLFGILILITFIWRKRKRQMVKRSIFDRQNRAADAKF